MDEDEEEDTEIRIVKRVEDYYPESKFTARYNNERVLVLIEYEVLQIIVQCTIIKQVLCCVFVSFLALTVHKTQVAYLNYF